MSLEADIDVAIKALYKYGADVAKNRQRIAALGGAYVAAYAEAAAPRSAKIHKRYSTPKLNKGIRAPKGAGRVAATYYPGNLARSIQVLRFSRAKSKVFVGAKLAKGQATGTFGRGTRTDGYYLHMVEKGTKNAASNPFFLSAVERSKGRALQIMLAQWEKLTRQHNANVK